MVKTLERAMAEISTLPAEAQEHIGRELLAYVEQLRTLRADIDAGLRSIDAGRGEEIDIGQILKEARQGRAKA